MLAFYAQEYPRRISRVLPIYCPIQVKPTIRNLQAAALSIREFRKKNCRRQGSTFDMGTRKAKHLYRCAVKQCGIRRVQRALVTSICYVTQHTVCRLFYRVLNDILRFAWRCTQYAKWHFMSCFGDHTFGQTDRQTPRVPLTKSMRRLNTHKPADHKLNSKCSNGDMRLMS
jgi:hypothetical protein